MSAWTLKVGLKDKCDFVQRRRVFQAKDKGCIKAGRHAKAWSIQSSVWLEHRICGGEVDNEADKVCEGSSAKNLGFILKAWGNHWKLEKKSVVM